MEQLFRCVETNEAFTDLYRAAKKYGTKKEHIYKCLKGKSRVAGRYNGEAVSWEFV
jgi:DNA-binding phage protein